MAVAVVEKVSGHAANAAAVTVTFADAVAGDLIQFVYGTDFKEFGNGDWLPNSGWKAIPSTLNDLFGFTGMCWHIVQTDETSWTPVNDDGNTVPGAWIAYRTQGHSVANPVLNFFTCAPSTLYPNTVPGANSVLGMMFTGGMLPSGSSTAISGGVSGGNSWHIDTQNDGSGNPCVAAYVAAIDNITPATGTWAGHVGDTAEVQEWVVQAAPGAPTDVPSIILNQEVVVSDFSPSSGTTVAFDISWTPNPENYLLAIFGSSPFFPNTPITVTSHWTVLAAPLDVGFVAALRTVQPGDGTAYTVSTTMGITQDWYCYVYEIAGTTYSGLADGDVTSPNYTTPFEGGTGETLCFFPITIYTDENNAWPQYGVGSGQTPDGCGTSSINRGGTDDKFVSVSSHEKTSGGGSGVTTVAATTNQGYGASIVFDITSVPCNIGTALNFTGNVSGKFYATTTMGAETVPVKLVDSTVTIDNGTLTPAGQTIANDGQWAAWAPNSGPLLIAFPNGLPVRTIWVLTNLAKGSPPSIPVWASSQPFSLWKQTCTVPS